ncbi:MAG: ABC transporter permease [Acidimicrobiaceae bacterium]|nr:ABC transporter permease [Acidimicrobiaceae bacterium]MXW74994.1 ABC transporter permease [Acidimicrobiaceae bacterium]MYA73647.1 ABC transporter permease [Acidimicrobiaceae bacterium]MYD06566.1 ABC transporter permease [Acidimicrobiaceae bacterium]MYG55771.1 ABC transporter permease [Acidimicrobiaceae bacterium]
MTRSTSRLPSALKERLAQQRQEGGLRQYVVYLAFVLILITFSVLLQDDGFLTSSNLLNIGRQSAPIAVMAVGMTFALGAGEIDLSVGSTVALSSLVAADLVGDYGFAVGALGAILVAMLIGLLNGLITVKVRIPSFLVTLGTLGIVSGIARNWNNLQSLPIRNDTFTGLFGAGSLGPVSSLLIWTALIGTLGHLTLHQLRWGRHILATGADRDAANAVGINTVRVRLSALMVSATAAGFAGVLLAGRLAIGRHDLGQNDLLTVIAAVVIGGTSLFGGRASVTGAVTGAVIMAMLNNGLILMGLEVADQMIARGVIIIVAVALSMREQRES